MTKLIKHDGLPANQWDEYEYLFDLILVEKRNPNRGYYHPKEEMYDLMKKIAESNLSLLPYRNHLIALVEEGEDI